MCSGKKPRLIGRLLKPALPTISKWLSGMANILPEKKDSCSKEKHEEQTLSCSSVSQTSPTCLDPKPRASHGHFWDWEEQGPALV